MRYRPTGRPRRSRPLRRRERPGEALVPTADSVPASLSSSSGALVTGTGAARAVTAGGGVTGTGATGATGGRAGRVSPILGRSTARFGSPTLGSGDAGAGATSSPTGGPPARSGTTTCSDPSSPGAADSGAPASSSPEAPGAPAPDDRGPAGRLRRRRGPEEPARDAVVDGVSPASASPPGAGRGAASLDPVSLDPVSPDALSVLVAPSPARPMGLTGTPPEESTPSRVLLTPGSVDAGAGGGPVGSAAGCPALVSDMGTIPSRTAHDARSHTTAAPAGPAVRGSQREPSRSIH